MPFKKKNLLGKKKRDAIVGVYCVAFSLTYSGQKDVSSAVVTSRQIESTNGAAQAAQLPPSAPAALRAMFVLVLLLPTGSSDAREVSNSFSHLRWYWRSLARC